MTAFTGSDAALVEVDHGSRFSARPEGYAVPIAEDGRRNIDARSQVDLSGNADVDEGDGAGSRSVESGLGERQRQRHRRINVGAGSPASVGVDARWNVKRKNRRQDDLGSGSVRGAVGAT